MTPSLPEMLIRPLVENALREDFGQRGDLTSAALLAPDDRFHGQLVARQAGVLCGIDLARLTFAAIDPNIQFTDALSDGAGLRPGSAIARIRGPARSILMGERVALNFLTHLSGIASATAAMVAAIAGTKARVTDTRKTLPGLRMLQKYAVRVGGGVNHRFGLDDAILIKDNHVLAVGGVANALKRARSGLGHLVKIELEVDRIDQIHAMLACPPRDWPDVILLDNMTPPQLREVVGLLRGGVDLKLAPDQAFQIGKILLEASGGVTLASIPDIAASGVDIISSSKLTTSANAIDIALDGIENTA